MEMRRKRKQYKETQSERLDRIHQSGNHLVTKIVPDKKNTYNRQKFKRGL